MAFRLCFGILNYSLSGRIIFLFIFCVLFQNDLFAQAKSQIISGYLESEREKNGLLTSDIREWRISDQYTDQKINLTHVYLQQQHAGIVVFNAITVMALRDSNVVYFKSGFVDHVENKVNVNLPSIDSKDAIRFALQHLRITKSYNEKLVSEDATLKSFTYDIPEISGSPVVVQLMFTPYSNRLLLSWNVSIELKDEPHWWNVRLDATNGNFIEKNDYTVHCNFDENAEADIIPPEPLPVTAAEYRAFPYPEESPSFGNQTLLTDPSEPTASPFGWHDTNGSPGEEFTITRGNNVYAYEDADFNDLPGYSPDGGMNLDFDFLFTPGTSPNTNRDASLTNLFYANNRIHDFLYKFGFDEMAGNFQQNNYGNGGIGNDYIKAEGFNGSGNNASFNTPPDGLSGRMQMFIWISKCGSVNVTSSTFNGSLSVSIASFSFSIFSGSVTADLVLVNDGVATTTDACTSIQNNISGKIALIDRGNCDFIDQAQFAQTKGAVGVIIANNTAGSPPPMSGSPPLSIPCLSISQSDGNLLKSALLSGTVNTNITVCSPSLFDPSFDNGVITHEYGHGVSIRLTGGPSQANCLHNAEQGGEGWSDWLAMTMTIEPGDHGSNARGLGSYVLGQPPGGFGIRRFPYSTDMSINPQTYADVAANPEAHAIGEIWCDAIWDMTWFLINDYGYSSDPMNATAGNNIAIRLVLEGMKLQPCSPGFLDARDAILNADAILYNNAHRCSIWEAFARRGMGYDALQGSANSATDQTAGFSMPPFCLPVTLNLKLYIQGFYTGNGLMDNSGAGGNLFVIGNPGSGPSDVDTVTVDMMNPSPPYSLVERQRGILHTNGTLTVIFNSVIIGNSYYLRIGHRNSVDTWSKLPITISATTNYDFTIASTQAYDDGFNLPMKQVDSGPDRWAIYNGDIDQDGTVTSLDMTAEENDANIAAFGYNASDLDGDGASSSLDMTLIENNGAIAVFTTHP